MSNVEKVIDGYEELLRVSDAPLVIITEVLWIIVLIFLLAHIIKRWKSFSRLGSIIRAFFLIIVIVIVSFEFYTISNYNFSMNENYWKKNYLTPYITSLPENKRYVEDFSQIIEKKDSEKGIKSFYLSKKVTPIWVSVSIVDKSGSKENLIVQTTVTKESIKKPYLTYKKIEKTISDKYVEKAYYQTTLHIPEEYKVITQVQEP